MTGRDKKEKRIDARLTAEAKQQIEQAAALQGRSTSDFMVQAALKEASVAAMRRHKKIVGS